MTKRKSANPVAPNVELAAIIVNCSTCDLNEYKYFGCIDIPECDFMTWQKPSGKNCPKCGNVLLTKGQKLVCANEACGYREDQENNE